MGSSRYQVMTGGRDCGSLAKGRKRREVIEYNHEIKRLMYQEPETWRPYKTG